MDVFFLKSFLLDTSAMLAAGVITNCRIRIVRCVLTCIAGVVISVFLLLNMDFLMASLVQHVVVNPWMTWMVFGSKDRVRYLRNLLTVYIIIFFMGGIQSCIGIYFGRGMVELLVSGLLAAVISVIYMIRRNVICGICQVDLWLQEKKITVNAYVDSGNLLHDPDNGIPVSIVQRESVSVFQNLVTEKRKIGYRTLNDADGILEVMILDKMTIYQKGTAREVMRPEIGLYNGEIMQHPKVQLLLNAVYF